MRLLSVQTKIIMQRNNELPRDEQVRIVLRNYDKKAEECEALKKENEKLKKQLEQKEILYKNMLERLGGNKSGDQDKYKRLYDEVLESHSKLMSDYKFLREDNDKLRKEKVEISKENKKILKGFTGIRNMLKTVIQRTEVLQEKHGDGILDDEEENVVPAISPKEEQINPPTVKTNAYEDYQLLQFGKYISTMIANFKKSGSLMGISKLAKEYGVRSLTKEQFFQFGLNGLQELTNEHIASIYRQVKKH